MRFGKRYASVVAALTVMAATAACAPPTSDDSDGSGGKADKYVVYNNLSYSGNAWSNKNPTNSR